MRKWVQHVSGEGKKWEVHDEIKGRWLVKADEDTEQWRCYELPQSEYKECQAPERWARVHVGIRGSHNQVLYMRDSPHILNFANLYEGFRWVLQADGSILVEKREELS